MKAFQLYFQFDHTWAQKRNISIEGKQRQFAHHEGLCGINAVKVRVLLKENTGRIVEQR